MDNNHPKACWILRRPNSSATATTGPTTTHADTSPEPKSNLSLPFNIAFLDEVEKDAKDAMGGVKHYHIFHIVAQKR